MQIFVVALLFFSFASGFARADDQTEAGKLARQVWKKCGGEEWTNVQEVRFTFVEEERGKELFSAEHIWNVPGATDEVKWDGKQIKVNLAAPAADEDSKAAYARWVNDSNWLMAPLKLCDAGAELQSAGTLTIDDQTLHALRLQFKDAGKTRHEYVLYIDQRAGLVRYWDYPSKDGAMIRGTWEGYQPFSGIILSTRHRFGDKGIRLTNVRVSLGR